MPVEVKMKISEFEEKNNVNLRSKSSSLFMRILGFFIPGFMDRFWTTIRLPFDKRPTIYYPVFYSNIENSPADRTSVLDHELVHVEDMRSSWGLFKMFWLVWALPLPIIFSGRWYIERQAYLVSIIKHGYTIDYVVNTLWSSYLFPWPKPIMRRWFEKQVALHNSK